MYKMGKSTWVILTIIVALVILVVLFWDKFIIREEEIISIDYCEADGDCVLGISVNDCCHCPIPLNKKAVELDEDIIIYINGEDYSSYNIDNEMCARIECTSCDYPLQIKCQDNRCVSN